jgi:Uma2 family endonuclease
MLPTASETSGRNTERLVQLQYYAKSTGARKVFESSVEFRRRDGSLLSPDAFLVRLQRRTTPRLCPLCPI